MEILLDCYQTLLPTHVVDLLSYTLGMYSGDY